MSFFAKMVGISKEKEMLKRMYASFGRESGRKTMGRSMLGNNEMSENIEELELEGIKGRLIAMKLRLRKYLISFDQAVMKKYFGGATVEDEDQDKEDEEIEEDETLKIFVEQHRQNYDASQAERRKLLNYS